MRCLVFVKFLSGGSLAPEEFFGRINAQFCWLEDEHDTESKESDFGRINHAQSPRSAFCIAEYEAIEQLAIDLSIMPGAGISNVEVVPISEEVEHKYSPWELSILGPI
jgi:hypothetical protein